MRSASPTLRFTIRLFLMAAVAVVATMTAPADTHFGGVWPVGIAALVAMSERQWALLPRLLVIAAVAWVSFLLGGLPTIVALAYAGAVLVEAAVVRLLLHEWLGDRLRLVRDRDVLFYFVSTAAAALAGAILMALASHRTGLDSWWHVLLPAFVFHWLSHLLFIGVAVTGNTPRGAGDRVERVVRWVSALALVSVAFYASRLPMALLLVFPVLTWGALRASFRETAWQLIVVASAAIGLAFHGHSAVVSVQEPLAAGLLTELDVLPVAVFLLVVTLTCLPLAVAVGRARLSAVDASRTATRLDTVISAAPDVAILELDAAGRVVLMNPGAEAILGPGADVLGRPIGDLGTPDPIITGSIVDRTPSAADEMMIVPQEWRPHRDDGEDVLVALSVVSLREPGGTLTGYVVTARDVTERVQAQHALHTALEAERLAVDQLREVNETKTTFVSNVSHELRTPLTNIIGWLELLREDEASEGGSSMGPALSKIDRNSQRLLDLIDSLLLLSELKTDRDAGHHTGAGGEIKPVATDLTEVVRSVVRAYQPGGTRSEHPHRVMAHLPIEPRLVNGRGDQLGRLVTELCDNAVKYTPDAGVIVVMLRPDSASGLLLSVTDSGVGLTAKESSQVFEQFARGSYAEERAIQGAGVGLSLARDIARAHGGDLWVVSAPGRGSTFNVRLPALSSAPVALPAVALA